MFGSVTAADIIEAVNRQSGVELDRRRLVMDETVKTLGTHEVGVRLHPEVEFRLTFEVVELELTGSRPPKRAVRGEGTEPTAQTAVIHLDATMRSWLAMWWEFFSTLRAQDSPVILQLIHRIRL